MSAPTESDQLAHDLFSHPVLFARGVLGHRLWSAQKRIMASVVTSRRTAVKGCNGSGKAFAAADLVCYWISAFPDGIVITTSPNDTQLRKVMWAYIARNMARCRVPGWKVLQKEIQISESNYALGFTTNEAERFSGWHGKVLIVVDEAPGVPQYIFEAIEGIEAAGDVHLLLLGNPTIPTGPFYDAFGKNAATWSTISVDAFDTPNLRGLTVAALERMSDDELNADPWPQLTRRRWVLDLWRTHGNGDVDNPDGDAVWQARGRAQFPSQNAKSLYPLRFLEPAQRRAPDPGGPVIVGIDVAGPGEDETAVCIRCGDVILAQHAFAEADARGPVARLLRPWSQRIQCIFVDEVGMGYYFMLHLADLFGVERVIGVNVGTASVDPSRFVNLKAELHWMLRERLQLGGVLNLQDREAFGQAVGLRFSENGRGQTVIESKEAVKKREGASPDRFEAVMLAYVQPRDISGATPKAGRARGSSR